jgi:hypothetical protein
LLNPAETTHKIDPLLWDTERIVSILVSYRPTYKNCFRVEYGPITRLKFIAYHKPILHYEEEPPLRSRIKQKYTKNLQVPQQQLHRANSSIFKRHRVCECTRTAFSALIVILVSWFYFFIVRYLTRTGNIFQRLEVSHTVPARSRQVTAALFSSCALYIHILDLLYTLTSTASSQKTQKYQKNTTLLAFST